MKKITTARKPGGKKPWKGRVSKNPVRPTKYEHQFDVENKLTDNFSFTVESKGKAHGNMDIYRESRPHDSDEVYHSKYTLHDIKKWEQSGKKKPLGEFVQGLTGKYPWGNV